MKHAATFFRLIRWPNLLIILLVQASVWFSIIHPLGRAAHHAAALFLTLPHFLLLSVATVLIAASGYVINDYFDQAIDRINKPEKTIVGLQISKKAAVGLYVLLSLCGLGIAVYLAIRLQTPALALIQMCCILLLLVYAMKLKGTYLWGNLAVSLLTGLTLLVLIAYEPALYPYFKANEATTAVNPLKLILLYAYFAFMTTWIREIVKDVQDRKGDRAAGCQTLPVRSGKRAADRWIIGLSLLVMIVLAGVALAAFRSKRIYLSLFIVIALIVPIGHLAVQLLRPQPEAFYIRQSKRLKLVMLLGLLPLLCYGVLASCG